MRTNPVIFAWVQDVRSRVRFGLLVLCVAALAPCHVLGGPKASPPIEFNRDIRPILSDNCYHCHGPDKSKRKAKLRMDSPEGVTADLGGYAAIVPGDPQHSEAFKRMVTTDPDDLMPPPDSGRKLTREQIELLERCIRQRAKCETHWSFQPPERSELPKNKNHRWARNEIDRFILARLEKEKLKPSPEAPKETLIRRVTLDLTGLPPTPDEVDRFLKDKSPDAYDKVVDRLLASPRYGERMALEWLDAARYADSNGYQHDATRTMWPWRDWLVKALNENMPFDQFTIEMLAGDLIPNATTDQKIASGFNRNHPLNGEGGRIPEESRVDYVVDRVDTTSTVWMGLTLACARCHDHKYDPLSQKEYFQIYDFFNHVPETGKVDAGGMANPVMSLPTPEQTQKINALNQEIASLENKLKGLSEDSPDKAAIAKKLEASKKSLANEEKAVIKTMVMQDQEQRRDTFILVRGVYDNYGEKVGPGTPAAVSFSHDLQVTNRLGLARWLMHPSNPLTARVTVNRYWQQFFGVGLVKTSEDFGLQGEWPSNKELLDWLATEFVRTGWDVKAMHRLMVTSATYRQSSRVTPQLLERDPDNRLLARGPRFRLPSLVLRDQALAVSGLLNEKIGGPPVKPYQPPGLWEEMSFGKIKFAQDHGDSLYRRSLYIFWRRTLGPTMFFDTSARQVCTVKLPVTNTPLMSLVTLNETGHIEAARVLGERMMSAATSPEERIRLAFRLATARHPSSAELKILQQRYHWLKGEFAADKAAAEKLTRIGEAPIQDNLDAVELAACTGIANVILNLDEVLNKE